jgi:tripartite-type tricarboxylate transporter receptor subunit TctC
MTAGTVTRQAMSRAALAMVCSLISSAGSDSTAAEGWPSRTITAIVPLGAGTASDIVTRIVLEQVSKQLGTPIVIENRVGAGGTLGANLVAQAAPDGYTLLASGALATGHALYPARRYDTLRDFIPVAPLGQQPLVLVAAPSNGFKTLGDLIAAAKARPGVLNFGSAGIGSAGHFAIERLRVSAGFDAQHIPFRGAQAMTEVVAGRVDFAFSPLAPALPLIDEGKLIALATSGPTRARALPNVPTTLEMGVPNSSYVFFVGLYLPAKTPRDIVVKLHQETARALQAPWVQERLAQLSVEPMPMSLEQFDRYFRDNVEANANLVKAANIPIQQ